MKTKYLSKNLKYPTSTELRLSEAVLEWNEENWEDQIMEKLNLKYNDVTFQKSLDSRKKAQKKKNELKRSEEFKEKRRKERNSKSKRLQTKSEKGQFYLK